MLQNLLAERFHLRLHHESQMRPGYDLAIARGGPKLKKWAPADSAAARELEDADLLTKYVSRNARGVFPIPPPPAGGVAELTVRDSMAMFCRALTWAINVSNGLPALDRGPRVMDRTGLAGDYEFTIQFGGSANRITAVPPPLTTVLEKQLGLTLREAKDVAVDVLAIDSADQVPSGN